MDETKAVFISSWVIRRILATDEVSVTIPNFSGGTVSLVDLTSLNLDKSPKYFASYSTDGTHWHQIGEDFTFINASSTALTIGSNNASSISATVKYWVFNTEASAL